MWFYVFLVCLGLHSLSIAKIIQVTFVFLLAQQPTVGQGILIHEVFRSHTTTHHSWQDSPVRGISSSQGPPPDNVHHPQKKNMHSSDGIRTHKPSEQEAADHALDRAATGIGSKPLYRETNCNSVLLRSVILVKTVKTRQNVFLLACLAFCCISGA